MLVNNPVTFSSTGVPASPGSIWNPVPVSSSLNLASTVNALGLVVESQAKPNSNSLLT